MTSDAVSLVTAERDPTSGQRNRSSGGADHRPKDVPSLNDGDTGIRELYFNMLCAAGEGDLVYIENQYFFDHGIISEIHEAAERGAKIIAILTSKPDEGTLPGKAESVLEDIAHYQEELPLVAGHAM